MDLPSSSSQTLSPQSTIKATIVLPPTQLLQTIPAIPQDVSSSSWMVLLTNHILPSPIPSCREQLLPLSWYTIRPHKLPPPLPTYTTQTIQLSFTHPTFPPLFLPRLHRIVRFPSHFDNLKEIQTKKVLLKNSSNSKNSKNSKTSCSVRLLYKQHGPWQPFVDFEYAPMTRKCTANTNHFLAIKIFAGRDTFSDMVLVDASPLLQGAKRIQQFWKEIENILTPHAAAVEYCCRLADNIQQQSRAPEQEHFHARFLVVRTTAKAGQVRIYHHGTLGFCLKECVEFSIGITPIDEVWKEVEERLRRDAAYLQEYKTEDGDYSDARASKRPYIAETSDIADEEDDTTIAEGSEVFFYVT